MTIIDNRAGSTGVSPVSTYTHDELGRRLTREQSGSAITTTNTDTFDYNSRSEVEGSINSANSTAAYNPKYYYDQIGNRTRFVDDQDPPNVFDVTDLNGVNQYIADELNQYDSVGGVTYTYDDDGNLTNNGSWAYTWNGENRLTTATRGDERLLFTYDYMGRLARKVNQTENQTTGNWETDDEVVYVYDGWNRIATFDASNLPTFTLAKRYLWGLDLSGSMQGAGGVGGLLSESEISNGQISNQRYALYDANGNIVQKLDGTGAVVMNVEYDPFGNIVNGTLVGEYGFSTKPLIDDLDWYYYGFRYYDPVTGRWPSRDPIEEEGGLNMYGFVGNWPIGVVDILGAQAFQAMWVDEGFSYTNGHFWVGAWLWPDSPPLEGYVWSRIEIVSFKVWNCDDEEISLNADMPDGGYYFLDRFTSDGSNLTSAGTDGYRPGSEGGAGLYYALFNSSWPPEGSDRRRTLNCSKGEIKIRWSYRVFEGQADASMFNDPLTDFSIYGGGYGLGSLKNEAGHKPWSSTSPATGNDPGHLQNDSQQIEITWDKCGLNFLSDPELNSSSMGDGPNRAGR